jgi:hypothetical protein
MARERVERTNPASEGRTKWVKKEKSGRERERVKKWTKAARGVRQGKKG